MLLTKVMSETVNPGSLRLRNLISKNGTFAAPGVFSASTALIAKEAGFECMYFSGAAFSNLLGLPDLGVTTLTEITDAVGKIVSKVDLPLIVDADTGFGEAVNVSRTVNELEKAGAAAIHIEDQVMPKKCGHLSGKEIVPPEEMMKKIIAAKQAAGTDLVIIARTDAAAVEGLDGTIKRSKLYIKAGADMIFPDALETKEQFLRFSKEVPVPLIANMTEFGKTPYFTVKQFSEMHYKFVLFPVTAFRAAMKAVEKTFNQIAKKGTQEDILKELMTRKEFYELSDYYSYERLDREIARKAKRLTSAN